MKWIVYLFLLLLVYTNIKSIIRLRKSYKFLKKHQRSDCNCVSKSKIKIIIPAMNEVSNVEKSITYFKKLSKLCDVIYVTTSKEKNKGTFNEIKKIMNKYKTTNINVINCPNTFGTMANQVNYVSKMLDNEDIIALYNIDSFPEEKTFNYVLNNINDDIVLQQVSFFDDKNKFILNSAQNWQNRWSLIYEMGKYLNDSNFEFKYTIGHGLFLKKKLLDQYGYWSEEEINEDNEFGYRLLINDIKIKPIPFMEQADFANTLSIYVKQQSTWVNGPLYAFSYFKKNKRSLTNLILSILNFKAFLSWWLFPLANLVFIILSLSVSIKIFIIHLLLLINYISVINYFVNCILKKMGYTKTNYNINIFSDLIFFLVHSFGSYITLYKLVSDKNNIKNKYNTEK